MAMAESRSNSTTSTSSDESSYSPITKLAQDHLFSILLLLPIESILCFAMTCRRLKFLAYSDSLWESVCRRDWGNFPIDVLKASNSVQGIHWKNLYQQVHQLDTVCCHKLLVETPDGDVVLPSPPSFSFLNFVNGCLVLFGGGCDGGRHLDDTWISFIGNDFRRTLKWQHIDSGIPSGRFGHSCVVFGDSLVLFGGINNHGIRQNDTWVGQVIWQETLGITLSWRLLDVGVISPPPRGAHAGCCLDCKKMLIHGGIGLSSFRLGDTWILSLSENLCFGMWQEIVTHPCPPSRSGHTLTHIGGTQIILFGGRGSGYEILNDVWLLSESEGRWRWIQQLFELGNIPQGFSLAQVGHSANLILGGRLLIYGGEDSYRHRKDGFWVLDISLMPSIKMEPSNLHSKGLLRKMWRRLESTGEKPKCRSFHQVCVDHSGRYLYVFGGMVDGLLESSKSLGLRVDGGIFLVELVLQS